MKLSVSDREDVSAVFVVDEEDETVFVDVTCNETLVREMVKRFNAYEALADEAKFLLERLSELTLDDETHYLIRDWEGHVEPSMARLRMALGSR